MNIIYKAQKRKSIGLYPIGGDTAEVRYPIGMPRKDVDSFVKKHTDWAREALRRKNEERALTLSRWMTLPFLGKEYPILPAENGKISFSPDEGFRLPDEGMAENAEKLYRAAAKDILTKKTAEFSRVMGAEYKGVKINAAVTRWGSCSAANSINFSFYLIIAPEEAVDYVVVHELAHTVHHDHSPAFWSLVEHYCPDFRERKKALEEAAERRRGMGLRSSVR